MVSAPILLGWGVGCPRSLEKYLMIMFTFLQVISKSEFLFNWILHHHSSYYPLPVLSMSSTWHYIRNCQIPLYSEHHWSKAALGLISDSWEKYFIKLLSQIHCPDSQSTIVSFPLIESRLRCSFLSPESLYIEGSRKVGIYFSFEINMPPQCP